MDPRSPLRPRDLVKSGSVKIQNKILFFTDLIAIWDDRYIVLNDGIMRLFKKRVPKENSGEGLISSLNLKDCVIIGKFIDANNTIQLKSKKGDELLVIKTENRNDAINWVDSIQANIELLNPKRSSIKASTSSTKLKMKNSTIARVRRDSIPADQLWDLPLFASRSGFASNPDQIDYYITPLPGFVIKTERPETNQSIYINICHNKDLPAPTVFGNMISSEWPFMLSSPCHMEEHYQPSSTTATVPPPSNPPTNTNNHTTTITTIATTTNTTANNTATSHIPTDNSHANTIKTEVRVYDVVIHSSMMSMILEDESKSHIKSLVSYYNCIFIIIIVFFKSYFVTYFV